MNSFLLFFLLKIDGLFSHVWFFWLIVYFTCLVTKNWEVTPTDSRFFVTIKLYETRTMNCWIDVGAKVNQTCFELEL